MSSQNNDASSENGENVIKTQPSDDLLNNKNPTTKNHYTLPFLNLCFPFNTFEKCCQTCECHINNEKQHDCQECKNDKCNTCCNSYECSENKYSCIHKDQCCECSYAYSSKSYCLDNDCCVKKSISNPDNKISDLLIS